MAVTREDVLNIARLARLRLTEEEVVRMTADLNGILAHVGELTEVEIEGVEAAVGATEWPAPLRADGEGAAALERGPAELAPAWEEGFFTVPRLAALDAADPGVESDAGPLPGVGIESREDGPRGPAGEPAS